MPKLTGAVIREQGVTFAVALVKNHVVNSQQESSKVIGSVSNLLGCPLVVLIGESNNKLRGNRTDLVNFVSSISLSRIPWKEYTFS